MRPENKNMVEFLNNNGIKADVKYIWEGSLRDCWRLTIRNRGAKSFEEKWGQWTPELRKQLSELGFIDFDGKPLTEPYYGDTFSLFVRGHYEQKFLFENKINRGRKRP
jgi:hypothetical protein